MIYLPSKTFERLRAAIPESFVTTKKNLDAAEEKKLALWKHMNNFEKHICLMYLYRFRTEEVSMQDYIETHYFEAWKLHIDDLPRFVYRMNPEQLRKEAYQVIGKQVPK